MKQLLPILTFCAALAFPVASYGQSFEAWLGGGVSMLSNNGIGSLAGPLGTENDVQLKGGFRINFRMAINTGSRMGHEVGYAYNRTQLAETGQANQGMAIHQGFYDFLYYATKEGARVRPFAAGGVQFSNFVQPGTSAGQGGGNTKFGVNYGAGVKVRLSSRFGLRFDFRQYATGKPFSLPLASGWLRQNELSGSFGFLM
jgi:opacity protein-like surface antigen